MKLGRRVAAAGALALLAAATLAGQAGAAPPGSPSRAGAPATSGTPRVPGPGDRVTTPDRDLAKGWKTSQDRAVTLAPDADGLHVLTADSKNAYAWRTAATLSETGFDADLWIGNYCLADRSHAVVVYAPRTFTNQGGLFQRGAFTAVVDLDSGTVHKLPVNGSLAYFDPSCDPVGHTAVFTQLTDDATRLVTVSAEGRTLATTTVRGELTSAVPAGRGAVLAADGHRVVRVDGKGRTRQVAVTDGTPTAIHKDAAGGVDFLDQTANRQVAKRITAGHTRTLATAAIGRLGLATGASGTVFLTGTPVLTGSLPAQVEAVPAAADADLSTEGRLAVAQAVSPGLRTHVEHPIAGTAPAAPDDPVHITATATGTGKTLAFAVPTDPTSAVAGTGRAGSPSLAARATAQKPSRNAVQPMATSSTTIDTDRTCAIARNDPNLQAYQPTSNQVEWAVDMAVRNDLTSSWLQETDWRAREGLSGVNPQSLFPLPALVGGGRIPAQILLGILTQESNLWQAEGGALPGQSSSPLTGNFYGHPGDAVGQDVWQIDWSKSDCGYGIGQITDGMRTTDTSLTQLQQKAIALDYASNIAQAAGILATKWNELQDPSIGITMNNNSASGIENWFAAVWDYNSGFNPPGQDASGHWGLGWLNNPANPLYPADRHPFLDGNTYADAAHPERWPYEEKVMGWAAWPIDTGHSYTSSGHEQQPGDAGYGTAGYNAAWWSGGTDQQASANRTAVKPPLSTFCQIQVNDCDVSSPPTCETDGLHDKTCDPKHWWTRPATWKSDCATTCGHENLKYVTLRTEPGNADSATPDCDVSKVPSDSLLIDSVSGQVPPLRSGCNRTWTDAGKLTFSFDSDGQNHYEGKADLHQIGGGFGDHFWYAHTRNGTTGVRNDKPADSTWLPPLAAGNMAIRGNYKLDDNINKWARVWVHIPATGATTQQAVYEIHTGATTKFRVLNTSYRQNLWVPLGVFQFFGNDWQGVALTNWTLNGTADDDVAWDAVDIQPLPGAPRDFVVSMGDSYSSGEGAADSDADYTLDSNWRTATESNGCHRSLYSWPRKAQLRDRDQTIGEMADSADPNLDYHAVACSGAQTPTLYDTAAYPQSVNNNDLYGNFFGELPQIQQGYLDENTTLVTFSIGGNDMRFGDVLTSCILATTAGSCANSGFSKPRAVGDDAQTTRYQAYAAVDGKPNGVALPALMNGMLKTEFYRALDAIRQHAPNAKIVVMGYPQLFEKDGACVRLAPLGTQPGLSSASAAFMNQMAYDLDSALDDYVLQYPGNPLGTVVKFLDPTVPFEGHGVCGDDPAIIGVRLAVRASETGSVLDFLHPSAESFHPNKKGTDIYGQILDDYLSTFIYP